MDAPSIFEGLPPEISQVVVLAYIVGTLTVALYLHFKGK